MQSSLNSLRETVEAHERQASNKKWGDLFHVQADVAEFDGLAKAALEQQKSSNTSFGGLAKFSTVALEYSKLLDVIMNQCPEYVSLAWESQSFCSWRTSITRSSKKMSSRT